MCNLNCSSLSEGSPQLQSHFELDNGALPGKLGLGMSRICLGVLVSVSQVGLCSQHSW